MILKIPHLIKPKLVTEMPPQLFWPRNNKFPSKKLMTKVKGKDWQKPLGGLWTSTLIDNSSDWVRWCCDSDFCYDCNRKAYILVPQKDLKIYEIDSMGNLCWLLHTYPGQLLPGSKFLSMESSVIRFTSVDWPEVGKDFDGVHLTENGNSELHLGRPYDLNAWDVESTLWYKWKFEKDINIIEIPKEKSPDITEDKLEIEKILGDNSNDQF